MSRPAHARTVRVLESRNGLPRWMVAKMDFISRRSAQLRLPTRLLLLYPRALTRFVVMSPMNLNWRAGIMSTQEAESSRDFSAQCTLVLGAQNRTARSRIWGIPFVLRQIRGRP